MKKLMRELKLLSIIKEIQLAELLPIITTISLTIQLKLLKNL